MLFRVPRVRLILRLLAFSSFLLSSFLVGFTDVAKCASNPFEHLLASFPAFIVAGPVIGAYTLADPLIGSLLFVAGDIELVSTVLPRLLLDPPDNIIETPLLRTCRNVEAGANTLRGVAGFPPLIPSPVCNLPVEPA